jgi:hypothetical protein
VSLSHLNPGSSHRLHDNPCCHNMCLPHSDDQHNLEPPLSFQRASPRVYDRERGKRRAASDKHGRVIKGRKSEAENIGVTSSSISISKSRTIATPHTNSVDKNHACKNNSHHKLYAPSSGKVTSSLVEPGPSPATSQSGYASFGPKTTARSVIDAGAASRSKFFDPWNSSSTGHQRAENILSGSTSWRESRNAKLGEQFRGGFSGGAKRVADTVGAGSEGSGKDGRKENGSWEKGASGLRTGGQRSLAEVWGASKGVKGISEKVALVKRPKGVRPSDDADAKPCKFSFFSRLLV